MTEFELEVNKRIKELVDKSGLTQKEIAADAGINHTKLNKIMNPEKYTTTANAEDIASLARVLNVSTDYLLTGAEFGEREEQDLLKRMDSHDAKTAVTALAQFMIMCPYSFGLIEGKGTGKYYDPNVPEPIEWETDNLSLTIGDGSIFPKDEDLPPNVEIPYYGDYSYLVWSGILNDLDKLRTIGSFKPSQLMKMAEVIIADHLNNNGIEPSLNSEGDFVRIAGLPNIFKEGVARGKESI